MTDTHNKNPAADRHESDDFGSSLEPVEHSTGRRPHQKRFDVFTFDGLIHIAKRLAGAVTVLAAIAGLLWGLDFMIERKLSDESVLRKIAAHARPSLIFDAKESIIADMGALPFINPQDIRVTKRTADGMPQHVHIGFVRPVSFAPILTSVHDPADITCGRGRGLDWEFELAWDRIPVGKKDTALLFRLEVMP